VVGNVDETARNVPAKCHQPTPKTLRQLAGRFLKDV
jgi:hypothetical protein